MRKTNKGFSAILILILVVGIIFGGGYLYSRYNTIIPPPKPEFETGVYGKVISVSDVIGTPNSPLPNSLIFAVSRDDFEDFYTQSKGTVDDEAHETLTSTKTDNLGNYNIPLTPGSYALCFTYIQVDKNRIADCVELEIKENELQKVNISRQFDTQFSCVTEDICTKIELPQLETQILSTFEFTNNNSLTLEEASELVSNRPEVKDYLNKIPDGAANVTVETKEDLYLIHVFEVKNGHTATFNWYEVDKNTGAISTVFDY